MAWSESEQVVLEHAATSFADRGYAAVTLRDLVEATGVDSRRLQRRFGGKEGLLASIAAPLAHELEQIPVREGGRAADPVALVRAYIDLLFRDRAAARTLLTDVTARSSPSARPVLDARRRLVAAMIGGRAPLERQVRVHCALAMAQLVVGELHSVPRHRLRPALVAVVAEVLRAPDGAAPPVSPPTARSGGGPARALTSRPGTRPAGGGGGVGGGAPDGLVAPTWSRDLEVGAAAGFDDVERRADG